MYIVSSNSPCKKVLLTSNWANLHPLAAATTSTNRTVVSFATSVCVSWKSIPSSCVKPFAIKCALYLSIDPSALCFNLSTHLHPMVEQLARRSTMVQVLFCSSTDNFVFIASFRFGSWLASLKDFGSLLLSILWITYWKWVDNLDIEIYDWMRYFVLLIEANLVW